MTYSPAVLGFAMIGVFMLLVIRRWTSAVVALILVPGVFSLLAGFKFQTGAFMLSGIGDVAPTAAMLIFAVLYFGLMIDAGLFQPLVTRLARWAGKDHARATLGHAALSSGVGLDGDGTTTFLVSASSMLPVYRRLVINPLIYASIGPLSFALVNLSPWGGPVARIAAALHVDPLALFLPMLPVILTGLVAVYGTAWWLGYRERRKVTEATASPEVPDFAQDYEAIAEAFQSEPQALRPNLFWVNVLLTAVLMVLVAAQLAPLPVLFMIGTAMALLINYPGHAEQRKRLQAHGFNALSIGLMVLAAGAFTGVLKGTGMIDGMAVALLDILPDGMGPHLGLVTAVLSIPGSFFLSSDAFYFGVVPVLARSAELYGIAPEIIGRAALLGSPLYGISPLIASVYLNCTLAGVELGDLQRFAWKFALSLSGVLIAAALLFGAIPR